MGATVTRPTRRNCRTTNYNTQNLLARSLHPQCYERNPGFQRFVAQSGLPFGPLTQFLNWISPSISRSPASLLFGRAARQHGRQHG